MVKQATEKKKKTFACGFSCGLSLLSPTTSLHARVGSVRFGLVRLFEINLYMVRFDLPFHPFQLNQTHIFFFFIKV